MTDQGLDRELEQLAQRLEAERPVPAARFREALRHRAVASRRQFRRRARRLVLAYAGCGLVLLAIAAIGVAGGGPFASG